MSFLNLIEILEQIAHFHISNDKNIIVSNLRRLRVESEVS